MKTFLTLLLLLTFLFLFPLHQYAQEATASQAYWVHEDPVYPAKVADYEAYCATLTNKCTEFGITAANWFTISTDDLRYFHVSKIQNMADLDKSRFSVILMNAMTPIPIILFIWIRSFPICLTALR